MILKNVRRDGMERLLYKAVEGMAVVLIEVVEHSTL